MDLAPYGTSWRSTTWNTLVHLPTLQFSIFQRTPQGISCSSNWNDTYRSTNRNVNPGRTDRNNIPHKTRGLWPSSDFWCNHHSPWGNTVLQGQVGAFISSNTFFWHSQRQSIKVTSKSLSSLGYKGRYFFLKVLRQLCKILLAQRGWWVTWFTDRWVKCFKP